MKHIHNTHTVPCEKFKIVPSTSSTMKKIVLFPADFY